MNGKDIPRSHLSLVHAGRAEEDVTEPDSATALSPFSAAVPDRYFETPALRECHARVARAALDSDTVAVVEGERGCGKTTFVRMLQQRVGPSRALCYIDVRIPQGERYVFDCLRRAFCTDPAADMQALLAQLIERGRGDTGCLIVVDDADKLSVFALRFLFTLKRAVAQAGSQLGVVVTMSPARLEAVFKLPSFAPYRTRGLTRIGLPHLSAQETADYLRARIESAGMAGKVSFDETQVGRIHRASGGLPQQIKRVAGELLDGARPRRYRSAGRLQRLAQFRQMLFPAAVVIVPLAGIGLLLYAIFKSPADDAMVAKLMSTADIEAPGAAVKFPNEDRAAGAVDRASGTAAPVSTAPSPPAREAVSEPPAAITPPAVTETVAQARAVVPAPEPKSEPKSEPKPEPKSDSRPEPKPEPKKEAASQPAPAPEPTPDAPPPRVSNEAAAIDGNAWLRAQNPAHYTIQLAGADKREDVDEFIVRHALPGKTVVVEVQRSGKPWYMALYKSYPSWGEARRELESLPPQVSRNDPFARSFGSVQAIAPAP
ncbi:MAG: AAA family ATPase [Gammaproteobacteria bacterium]|nr:AAA family ATPase [Gammaproteobacteria bacterium]